MPMPPGFGKDVFSQLLRQLEDQHRTEVAALHDMIADLKQRLVDEGKQLPDVDAETHPQVRVTAEFACQIMAAVGDEAGEESTDTGAALDLNDNAVNGSEDNPDATAQQRPGAAERVQTPDTNAEHPSARLSPNANFSSEASRSSINSNRRQSRLAVIAGKTDENLHLCDRWRHIIDGVIGACILVNILTIFLGLEYDGYQIAVRAGFQPPGKWPEMNQFFEASQHFFCIIFLIELLLRLAVYKLKYFYSTHLETFNIADAIIVVFSVLDLYVIRPLTTQESNLTLLRALRFFRLGRALRVVRTFELFTKLRILMGTVVASFMALFWSMVLLFVVMLMFSLVMTQLIHPFLEDPTIREDTIKWMFERYGTAGRSLWTVFELTFSGGWPNYVRRLVEEVGSGFAYLFAVYISCVVFAMTRIITALFLKDTLQVAANDAEMVIQEKMNEKKRYAKKLMDVFEAADSSGDGKISLVEFEEFLEEPKVMSYLSTLELDTHEVKTLFTMLDDGDGHVTADEFVQGAIRLKGAARSQDVISIMHDFNHLKKTLEEMRGYLAIEAWRAPAENISLGRVAGRA